jgi:tetratricopeptide (TPR) repeat protein
MRRRLKFRRWALPARLLVLLLAWGAILWCPAAWGTQRTAGGGKPSPEVLADLTRQAHQDFASGRYSEARGKLRAALKIVPRNSALWTYLGLTEAQLNETDLAIADFEKALSLGPADARTLFNLGLLYGRQGNAGKAMEVYRQGLALEPDDAAANQNYALLLMEAGKFREAIGPLEKLKAIKGSDLSVRVGLIECYLKAGRKSEGEKEILEFPRLPSAALADELKLADVLIEDREPDAAQEVLEQAVRAAPNSAEAHGKLGLLLSNKNQFETAVVELGTAAQLDPDSAEYSLGLAEALLLWGHYPAALELLTAIKTKFEKLPEFQYKLGLAYYGMHQYPLAIARFEAMARERPSLDLVQFFLANSYRAVGDLKRAELYYKRAIELNPRHASYYLALGQLLRKESEDRTDEAIAKIEEALRLDPSDVQSKQELALGYEQKANYPRAQSLLEEVVRQQPDLLSAHVALARIYYRERKKEWGDRERKTISQLEARQQAQQSRPEKNPAHH